MHALFWGWAVVIAALAAGVPILIRAGLREDERDFAELTSGDTQVITALPAVIPTEILDAEASPAEVARGIVATEGLIIDIRTPVVDELGAWNPHEHTQEQPTLLGQVLTSRKWGTLTPERFGMAMVAV